MIITRISAWHLDLPLSKPYWLSGGRLKFERLDSTYICIETDTGHAGWGEACPWGHTYLPAHGDGIRAALPLLASVLVGEDPRAFDHLNHKMDVQLPGHLYAKAGLDVACWDLAGQSAGLPLWKMMGGAKADPVAVNSSISTGTPEGMVSLIKDARAAGYRTHSAKIGGDDLSMDIARIQAISSALLPDEQITLDVNRAWTPGQAVHVLNSTPHRHWVEQPCETLEQCAHVAARVSSPIMLDECLHSFQDHLNAWQMNAAEGCKVKPNRVGGLTKARQIRDFCVSVGWQMHIEDVGGTTLADTAALHLASSTRTPYRLASWLSHAHLRDDPVKGQGARNVQGMAQIPELPGLGITPDRDALGTPVIMVE